MKISNQAKCGYAAGIVDGEGSICIRRKKILGNGPKAGQIQNYYMSVTVTQKDGKLIDWLLGNFSGSTYLHWKGTNTGWSHEWILNHNKAKDFLKRIFPFLVYKKNQAELAIRFQERLDVFNNRKRERNELGQFPKGTTGLSDHELETRKKMFEELKALKHIHEFSKAPNVQKRVQEGSIVQL